MRHPAVQHRRRPNRHQRRKRQRMNQPARSARNAGQPHPIRQTAIVAGAGVLILAVVASRLLG